MRQNTYNQVSDDNSGQEERNAGDIADVHTVPHRLDPLPTQDSEHDHEGVHEVCEVPPWQLTAREAVHMVWKQNTLLGEKNYTNIVSKLLFKIHSTSNFIYAFSMGAAWYSG